MKEATLTARWKPRLRPLAVPLAFLAAHAAWAAWATWPLALERHLKMPGFGGDTALNAYLLAWARRSILAGGFGAFDANFLHPLTGAVGLSENLLGPALLFMPFAPSGDPVALYNAAFAGSLILNAFLWSLLLRDWRVSAAAAWAGGLLAGFHPWFWTQTGHVQLFMLTPGPVLLLCLGRWLRSGGWGWAAGFGAATGAGFYFCVYHFYFQFLFAAAFGLAGLATGFRGPVRPGLALGQIAAAAATAAATALPAALKYQETRDLLGGNPNPLEALAPIGACLSDYLKPSSATVIGRKFHGWLGIQPGHAYSPLSWEHGLSAGWAALAAAAALAVAWFTPAGKTWRALKPETARCAVMLAAGGLTLFLVSLGPVFHWRGEETGLPTPYGLLHRFLPGFNAIRVPPRAGVWALIALSLLAALAADFLFARSGTGKFRVWTAAGGLLLAVLIAETANPPLALEGNEDYRRHERVQRDLASGHGEGAVLILPLEDGLNYLAPMTGTSAFRPMVNGISGYLPSCTGSLFSRLRALPWGLLQGDLAAWLGLRHIVVDELKLAEPPETVLAGIEAGLTASGFAVERLRYPASKITVLELSLDADKRLQILGRKPRPDVTWTTNPKKKEFYGWISNAGGAYRLPPESPWAECEIAVFDEAGKEIHREERIVPLPPFLGPKQGIPVAIDVPKEARPEGKPRKGEPEPGVLPDEVRKRARRVTLEAVFPELGVSDKGELLLSEPLSW